MAIPASVSTDGNVKVTWVPTITNPAVPTATVLNGGTAIELSCYITAGGLTTGGDDTQITDSRLCERQTFSRVGTFTDTLALEYVYQAQSPAAADNKAFATLAPLTEGFIVIRWGQDDTEAYASGDIVDVYPVECNRQQKVNPEANTVLKISQNMNVTGVVERDVAVAT